MYNFLIFNYLLMILKTLRRKLYNFYIFGNQLKKNFAFNNKIIIINLLFKIFF